MDINLHVNRVSTHPVSVPVTYAGEQTTAMMPELEVELYHQEGLHGTFTLHFRSAADIAKARDLFKAGQEVCVSLAVGAPSVIETTADSPTEDGV